jgi:hypothetical protein
MYTNAVLCQILLICGIFWSATGLKPRDAEGEIQIRATFYGITGFPHSILTSCSSAPGTSLLTAQWAFSGSTGGVKENGERPDRLEIRDFVNNYAQFCLYIQALAELQKTGEIEKLSYFQVAG